MTPEEFKEKMQRIASGNDIEVRHANADDLLCDALEHLGYKDGVDIFRKFSKWYA